MRRSSRRQWEQARTLADLGQLTARWLERDIRDHPGGYGQPNYETLPLVPVLARANRAGLVTIASQPACDEIVEGVRWRQRGAVEMIVDPAAVLMIRRAGERAGLLVITGPLLLGWREHSTDSVVVTEEDGQPFTSFGAVPSRRFMRGESSSFRDCHPIALDAVCAAWFVALIDDWGRDQLWSVLNSLAEKLDKPRMVG